MSIIKTDLGTNSTVLPANSADIFCTHFQVKTDTFVDGVGSGGSYVNFKYDSVFTTLAQFKQYLADQYANGTPVIIAYPLSTASTESATPQVLAKSPVTQTEGSISNLPIATTESSHTTPTPQQPLPINCNNGVVKVSRNLLDMANANTHDGYINTGVGSPIGWATSVITKTVVDAINIKVGETYTFSSFNNISGNLILCIVNNGIVQQKAGYIITANQRASGSITAIADGQLYIQYVVEGQDFQLERGSTATPYMPYGIYTDGTTETVEVTGKNLLNGADEGVIEGQYLKSDGTTGSNASFSISNYIKIPVGVTSLTLSTTDTSGSGLGSAAYSCFYNSSKIFISSQQQGGTQVRTLDIPNNAEYIRVSWNNTKGQVQLEKGSTATAYEPYFNGGQATAENLFKVGTYQDVQEVLAGNVIRNVGIKVLDGTEEWVASSTANLYSSNGLDGYDSAKYQNGVVLCTHFVGVLPTTSGINMPSYSLRAGGVSSSSETVRKTIYIKYVGLSSVNDFKQYLTDQYAAGTPVIIVYPLATATTESVTGQPLTVQQGTNIVEITQASIDNLTMEVSYKAGVTVTITEVENAQLDNSVEVTING